MGEDINVNAIADTLNHKVDLPDGKSQSDIDYVVAFQKPTASNNYTWYRKYKSGWVEQGGIYNSANLTYPIAMKDTYYTMVLQPKNTTGKYAMNANNITTTGATINTAASDWHDYWWQVSGMSA